jgi:hypothetical protein
MRRNLLRLAALLIGSCLAYGQAEFSVGGRRVQVHSFASQGFAYSNANNYLTMRTNGGSLALTDFGVNVSTKLTDNLRVGAQVYDRNVGRMGNWRPDVDWAYADYKFTDWFGLRGGKVKTALGLYNDIQDMEFLHTWALMPQSTYPVDVRGDTIAHIGGDAYGNIPIKRLGTFSYTVFGGKRPNDAEGGYLYGLSTSSRVADPAGGFKYITSQTKVIDYYGGPVYGADLRWATPLKGLTLGASHVRQSITTKGNYLAPVRVAYKMDTYYDPISAFYAEFVAGNLKFAGEYRREAKIGVFNAPTGALVAGNENARSGYVSLAYRFTKWLELGAYHSRYIADWKAYHGDPRNHIFDQTVTARFDLNRYADVKIEGHFIDGAMINSVLDRGFYAAANPAGLKPSMNMLVVRLGYHM